MPGVSLYLLGSPRIELDGSPVAIDTRKAVALLAYLAATGETHRRDFLAALLWPEHDQSHALGALRRTLSALKKAVGPECLIITRDEIGTHDGCMRFDVGEYQQLLAASQTHNHTTIETCPGCVPLLEKAIAHYRGDFMDGFTLRDSSRFDDWQFFQADALRSQHAGALQKLSSAFSSQGKYDRAITYARRWLALDQLREEAHQELMKIYAMAGQRNAALRQYRECVRILDEELSVAPLEETTELYQTILENRFPIPDAKLELQPLSPTIPSLSITRDDTSTASELPLVGRTWELDTLLKAYFESPNRGHFFVLEGEAGIGKTRLAGEFLELVRRNNAQVIAAQCYKGESQLAYGPIIDGLRSCLNRKDPSSGAPALPGHWAREAARLVPEMDNTFPNLPAAPSLEGPGAQSHFFEGLRQMVLEVCLEGMSGVLFLDDLHWADEATLDFLTYVVRRLAGSPVFILVTWHTADVPPGHRLRDLLSDSQRSGYATSLNLERLKASDLAVMVEEASKNGLNNPPGLAERLYVETEGLPFFAVEYLASAKIDPPEISMDAWPTPHRIRDLLHSRLATVGETEWQILTTAATIGRSFGLQILRHASGRSELETISGLEALIEQGFIQERKSDDSSSLIVYDFTHDKLREAVFDGVSLARRRLLHKRVADALRQHARRQNKEGVVAGQIAQHYQHAGQDDLSALYYKDAGEYSQAVYANTEALAHFKKALALNHPEKSKLHESIADLHTLHGEYSAALTRYETAAALSDAPEVPRLEHKLGNVYHRLGEWDLAVCHFQVALVDMEVDNKPADLARLYADWSRTLHTMGDTPQAALMANQALSSAEESGNPRPLAQAHNILGIISRSQDDMENAQNHLNQSLAAAKKAQDPEAEIAALNNLALVLIECGDRERAKELVETALKICNRLGDRHHEAALLNNLADLLYADGQSDKAMQYLKKAVRIFSEIGMDGEDQQPEIWKLSTW